MYKSQESVYYSALTINELTKDDHDQNQKISKNSIRAQSEESQVTASSLYEECEPQIRTESINSNENIEKVKFDVDKSTLILQFISIIFYVSDVITDHILAIQYFRNQEWIYGSFTLACIFLPSIWITYRGQKWRGVKNRTNKDRVLLVFIIIFNLEPVAQYYHNYRNVAKFVKAKKAGNFNDQKKNYESLIARKRDVAQLRYWEGVMEAIPQLILQLYIMLTNYENLEMNTTLSFQLLSLCTSTLGLFLTFFNYGKTWVILKGIKMSIFGHICRCLRWFLPMVSRVLSIVLLTTVLPIYTAVILGIHLLVFGVWRYKTHINQGFAVVFVQSLIDTIISRDDTVTAVVISNLLLLTEDAIMTLFWSITVSGSIAKLKIPLICVISVLGVVGRTLHVINKQSLYKYERH